MAKVITFPSSAGLPKRGGALAKDSAAKLATGCARLLCEVIGDLDRALCATAGLVDQMPAGKARDSAREEVAILRSQLDVARALNEKLGELDRPRKS